MPLLDVRKLFIEFSGRYDLIVDDVDFLDKGADKYIRAGQKWLDRTFTIGAAKARNFQDVAIGTSAILVPQARVLRDVWMSGSARNKYQLEKVNFDVFRERQPSDPALVTNGTSQFWTPYLTNTEPYAQVGGSWVIGIDKFNGTVYNVPGEQWNYNAVLFSPPTSEAVTVEVRGLFYPTTLIADTDANFWTEREPNTLAMAACRALEQSYRNMQGVNDWEGSVRSELLGLEFDLADEESDGITAIEGSGL